METTRPSDGSSVATGVEQRRLPGARAVGDRGGLMATRELSYSRASMITSVTGSFRSDRAIWTDSPRYGIEVDRGRVERRHLAATLDERPGRGR